MHRFHIYFFCYSKSWKMETKHPVFWRFIWCGLVTTRALVGDCQNFAPTVSTSRFFLLTRLHGVVTQKNTKRIFTTGKTRCADSLLHHHDAFKVWLCLKEKLTFYFSRQSPPFNRIRRIKAVEKTNCVCSLNQTKPFMFCSSGYWPMMQVANITKITNKTSF